MSGQGLGFLLQSVERLPRPLTRFEVLMMLNYLSGGPYYNESLDQREKTAARCAALIKEDSLGLLIDWIVEPPAERIEDFQFTAAELLGNVLEKHPAGIEKVLPLLDSLATRLYGIAALSYSNSGEVLPIFASLIESGNTFSDDEINWIIDAVGSLDGEESNYLLERAAIVFADRIASDPSLRALLDEYLN